MSVKAIRCKHCSKTIPEMARYCAYCGTKVQETKEGREGFTFTTVAGQTFNTLKGMATVFNSAWEIGKYHLYNGDITRWLKNDLQRHDLARDVERIMRNSLDSDSGLETFLRLVEPQLPLAELQVTPLTLLDFGTVGQDQLRTNTVELKVTRGVVHGELLVFDPWVRLSKATFVLGAGDDPLTVNINIDTTGLARRQVHMSRLLIRSHHDGQHAQRDIVIPLRVAVPSSPPQPVFVPNRLNIELEAGERLTEVCEVNNRGDSPLNLELTSSEPWLRIRPSVLRNSGGSLEVVVSGNGLAPAHRYYSEIVATEQSTGQIFLFPVEIATRPAALQALFLERPLGVRLRRATSGAVYWGAVTGLLTMSSANLPFGQLISLASGRDFFTNLRCGIIVTLVWLAGLTAWVFERAQGQLQRLALARLESAARQLRLAGYWLPVTGLGILLSLSFLATTGAINYKFDFSTALLVTAVGTLLGFPLGFFRR